MIYLVPYAYDRMPDGRPREGIPAERLGSKARCDALMEVMTKQLGRDAYFVLTSGFTKESPDHPTDSVREPLAKQMGIYLRHNGFVYTAGEGPYVWGTYEETRAAIAAIEKIQHHLMFAEIYVSTNA